MPEETVFFAMHQNLYSKPILKTYTKKKKQVVSRVVGHSSDQLPGIFLWHFLYKNRILVVDIHQNQHVS